MEKYTRCQDTLRIKYIETDHNKYLSQKYLLETTCVDIKNTIKLKELDNQSLCSCSFSYERPDKYITLSIYKNNIFVGIYDNKKNIIEFDGNLNPFLSLNEYAFEHIKSRLIANIRNKNIERKDPVKEAWIKKLPLLDSIIDLKKEVNKLPEKQRDIIYHSLQYDNTVNSLIESFENRDIEQNMERE